MVLSDLGCNRDMTATRIYKHSSAGTDWAALVMGAGLGLTLALPGRTLLPGLAKKSCWGIRCLALIDMKILRGRFRIL